ncbi:hypothetical protein VTI74DRAFT_11411 [Chaetomium olivicolor]
MTAFSGKARHPHMSSFPAPVNQKGLRLPRLCKLASLNTDVLAFKYSNISPVPQRAARYHPHRDTRAKKLTLRTVDATRHGSCRVHPPDPLTCPTFMIMPSCPLAPGGLAVSRPPSFPERPPSTLENLHLLLPQSRRELPTAADRVWICEWFLPGAGLSARQPNVTWYRRLHPSPLMVDVEFPIRKTPVRAECLHGCSTSDESFPTFRTLQCLDMALRRMTHSFVALRSFIRRQTPLSCGLRPPPISIALYPE